MSNNIWYGFRWKVYTDVNAEVSNKLGTQKNQEHPFTMNVGFDARHYLQIYRNIIWAVRAAGDFSWGKQKLIYYLGGVDNWLTFGKNQRADGTYRYLNPANVPDPATTYAFQTLAVNLRGFLQNTANGNNALVINSEVNRSIMLS